MSEESKIEILEEKLDKHVTGYQVDRTVLIIAVPFLFAVVVGVIVFFGLNTSDAIKKAVEKAAELQAIKTATENAQTFEKQASEATANAKSDAEELKKTRSIYEDDLKRIDKIEGQLSDKVSKSEFEKAWTRSDFFIKGGNNGAASCKDFCDGNTDDWWKTPKGICIAARLKESFEPRTCTEVPGEEVICVCVRKDIERL